MPLLAALTLLVLVFSTGCQAFKSKVTYNADPYVAKRLEKDADLTVSFYVANAKGGRDRVVTTYHARVGEYVKAVRATTRPTTVPAK